MRKNFYEIFHALNGHNRWNKPVNYFIILLIFLNVVAVIAQSEAEIFAKYKNFFDGFEIFSISIFTIEYLIRLWVCVEDEKYSHPVTGRLRYLFSFSALVDLLAIFPFYLPLVYSTDMRVVRLLRVFRVVRLYKMNRYFEALRAMEYVLKTRKHQLFFSFVFIIVIMVVTSCFMYMIEHEAQPDKFTSIPRTMWYAISMLTVVKYHEPIFPVTVLGKILGAFMALMGLGIFALPTGIISSGLVEYSKEKMNTEKKEA